MRAFFSRLKELLRSIFLSPDFPEPPVRIGTIVREIEAQEEEPDRPSPEHPRYIRPEIVYCREIRVETRGKYRTDSGQARGLLVHYTAGRNHPGAAEDTLSYLAEQGLGCLVMGLDGTIYAAGNQPLDLVAFHAGKSQYGPYSGLSYHLIGMEICCPGRVDKNGVSWFGAEYPQKDLRYFPTQTDNISPGYYVPFSPAQEEALRDFCLWQLDVNPEFSIDWILGHDEVCVPRGRKTDPGGSLSQTMPEFRDSLFLLRYGDKEETRT